jgi:hypothetical protein
MNRRPPLAVRAAAALAVLVVPVAAQEPPASPLAARRFEVRPAAGEIRVDGVLDDAGWAGALRWDLPYEWSPGDNVTPPVETDFLVTFDERNLYVAWRCRDPRPAEIRANYMDRDSINTFVQDDHVVLMIDPFDDERRGWQFRINPMGVQADAIFSENEGIEDFSYDLIWESAAKIGPDGWVAEVAIPFSQLRFPREGGPQTWGFDVGRSYPRNVRHRITAWPRDRGRNCLLCQIDKVTGFANLEAGRNVELAPTVTATSLEARQPFPDGDFESVDEEVEPGLSARWGITSNLSLNAALNPDFSQVEADAAQLSVNERFALFFPEKRPFFLEGVDFFATPVQAIFTRTVVDPEWGLKLTGKERGNAIGVFAARDEHNALILPGNQGSESVFLEGEAVDNSVVRFRRDVFANSTVGVLYAGREGDDYRNRVTGIDANLRFDDSNSVLVQYLASDTRYPNQLAADFGQPTGDFDGDALYLQYQYQSRDWSGTVRWEDYDPGFRADSGFVPRVDLKQLRLLGTRTFWGEAGDWYDRLALSVSARRAEDHAGQLTDEIFAVSADYFGSLQSVVSVGADRRREYFGGVLHDGMERIQLYGEMQPGGRLKASMYVDGGDQIDYFNNQMGDLLVLNPAIEVKLGRHVNAQLSHTLQRLDVPGGELFEANLSQLRLVYNFNVRAFARAILQYTDVTRDPALHPFAVEAETERLFTQFLLSYKLNAQTVFFLGYSDNALGGQDLSLTRTDRTVFAKIGYAFLF